jgi:hypothetical protein
MPYYACILFVRTCKTTTLLYFDEYFMADNIICCVFCLRPGIQYSVGQILQSKKYLRLEWLWLHLCSSPIEIPFIECAIRSYRKASRVFVIAGGSDLSPLAHPPFDYRRCDPVMIK